VRFNGLEAFHELIKWVVTGFNAAGLDYMFTGALAASFYGVPRTTMDMDVVVKVSSEGHRVKLVSALKQAGLRVDEKRINAAFKPTFKNHTKQYRKARFNNIESHFEQHRKCA